MGEDGEVAEAGLVDHLLDGPVADFAGCRVPHRVHEVPVKVVGAYAQGSQYPFTGAADTGNDLGVVALHVLEDHGLAVVELPHDRWYLVSGREWLAYPEQLPVVLQLLQEPSQISHTESSSLSSLVPNSCLARSSRTLPASVPSPSGRFVETSAIFPVRAAIWAPRMSPIWRSPSRRGGRRTTCRAASRSSSRGGALPPPRRAR